MNIIEFHRRGIGHFFEVFVISFADGPTYGLHGFCQRCHGNVAYVRFPGPPSFEATLPTAQVVVDTEAELSRFRQHHDRLAGLEDDKEDGDDFKRYRAGFAASIAALEADQ